MFTALALRFTLKNLNSTKFNLVLRAFTLALCTCTFACSQAWAQATIDEGEETATLWVDASKGSDSNPGTQQKPLKTIGEAAAVAMTNNENSIGTKVIINPGTYREAITLQNNSKTTSLPMTFEAATNGTVTVSGADIWTGWNQYSGNSNIYTLAWPYQWGLCAADAGVPPYQQNIVLRREMIFVSGVPLTQVLSLSSMVVGTFYVNETGGTVYIWPPAGTNMSSATIEVSTRPNLFLIEQMSNVVVRGLTFQYANSCFTDKAVGTTPNTSSVLFDADSFLWNNGSGLFLPQTTYATVQNSIANHNGRNGTGDNKLKYGLYQNDYAAYNNWRGAQGAYYSWGTSGAHSVEAHNATFQNYTLPFNETFGIHWDTDNADITADNLVATENLAAAAFSEKNEGPITISNSYLCNGNPPVGTMTVGFELRNSEQVTLSSDVLDNNSQAVLVEGQPDGIEVTNWETGQTYNLVSQNFTLTNDILDNGSAQNLVMDSYLNGSDWTAFQSTLISDYNTWWNGTQSNPFVLPVPTTDTATNYSGWTGSTGQDQHSIYQSPSGSYNQACLISPSGTDYWFFTGNKAGVQTIPAGNTMSVTATVFPLVFSGRVNLSFDGVQDIPGATASWSSPSINTSGNSTFSLQTAKSTPTGTYAVTLIANSGNLTRTMTVSALVNTSLAIAPLTLNFASQYVGTSSSRGVVNIVNVGTSAVSISSITSSGPFTQTNTCGTSLAAGATCEVSVTFTPTGSGTLTGSLKIQDSDPANPQSVALSGIGTTLAPVGFTPGSLNFANQQVDTSSAPQTIKLTNNGSAALSLNGITVAGAAFAETNNCPPSIPAGGSCSISVTFTPPGAGAKTGTIYVTDSANPPNQTISLSGTGIQPVATVSPTSLSFGDQEVGSSSQPQKVTLTASTGALTITSITVSGASFSETNNCGTTLQQGSSCTISVTFSPAGPGSKTGTLYVLDNANPPSQRVSLSGTATQPKVSLSKAYMSFGNQKVGTSSAPQAITLTNTGSGALDISSITLAGVNPGDFSESTTCGAYVNAGASCTISATFTPTVKGSRAATISIVANVNNSPLAITITGYGD